MDVPGFGESRKSACLCFICVCFQSSMHNINKLGASIHSFPESLQRDEAYKDSKECRC
jgi:hypothetical protein